MIKMMKNNINKLILNMILERFNKKHVVDRNILKFYRTNKPKK